MKLYASQYGEQNSTSNKFGMNVPILEFIKTTKETF